MEHLLSKLKSQEVRNFKKSFVPENMYGSQATDIRYTGVPLALLKSM